MTDLAGLMRLFLHGVLPDSVEKAIYVDSDAFLLTDPALLWDQFSYGPQCHCIDPVPSKPGYQRMVQCVGDRDDRSGLCPRALAPPTFAALWGPPGPDEYHHVTLGDQSYWRAIVN